MQERDRQALQTKVERGEIVVNIRERKIRTGEPIQEAELEKVPAGEEGGEEGVEASGEGAEEDKGGEGAGFAQEEDLQRIPILTDRRIYILNIAMIVEPTE